MQRRTRLIATALAATTALGLIPATPSGAAPKPAQLHGFGSGGQLHSSDQFAPPGATPVIGTFDDQVGDDIVWYTPGAGGDAFWSSNQDGTWTASALSISGTYTPYVGSFGGEDKARDILWYSTTGASQLWDYEVEGGSPSVTKTSLPAVTGTGTILVGDFTSDGVTDVVRYRPGAQAEAWWDFDSPVSAAPVITSRSFSVNSTYRPVVGAFHTDPGGDYGDDILWYASGAAADSLWDFNPDGSIGATKLTVNGTFTPIVERWSGNQADDILWYAPGKAADSLWDFGPGHTVQKIAQTINGTYTPYICQCIDSGLGNREDIVWHGVGNAPDAVWSFNGTTFGHTSYSYPGTSLRGSKLAVLGLDSVDEELIAYS